MTDAAVAFTRRLLSDAGISRGMRVLDLGCGPGAVALMAADLVGPTGGVLGVDRDPHALGLARAQAAERGLANVSFAEGDVTAPSFGPDRFDAVIGRRVLMYLPDPAAALARLGRALRPGGRMVFQEHDSSFGPGLGQDGALPLHERAHRWIWATVAREGGDPRMGLHLRAALARAGLAVEELRAEAVVRGPGLDPGPSVGMVVRAMLPRILRHGVATSAEIEVETLDRRLAEELRAADATCVWDMAFGAWAHRTA